MAAKSEVRAKADPATRHVHHLLISASEPRAGSPASHQHSSVGVHVLVQAAFEAQLGQLLALVHARDGHGRPVVHADAQQQGVHLHNRSIVKVELDIFGLHLLGFC